MFLKNKTQTQIDTLDYRLTQLSNLVEENHNQITQLELQVATLEDEKKNLAQNVEWLEKRLAGLHNGLRIATRDCAPSRGHSSFMDNPQIVTDHVCVDIDGDIGVAANCIYCHPELKND